MSCEETPELRPIAEVHPEADGVWRRLGFAHGVLEEYPQAARAYRRAMELDSARPLYLNNYAWFASLAEVELERAYIRGMTEAFNAPIFRPEAAEANV